MPDAGLLSRHPARDGSSEVGLAQYKAHLAAARAEVGSALRFGRASNDYQGANESEVGVLFFDEHEQTPTAVLAAWSAVHRTFIERLRAKSPTEP